MYKTINDYTKESMIETIEREFKGKSVNNEDYSQCYYKSPEGLKCAIGCFIKDSEYTENFENKGILVLQGEGLKLPLDYYGSVNFQYCHDNMSNEISAEEQKQVLIEWIEKNVE